MDPDRQHQFDIACAEINRRLRSGDDCRAEEYLALYPQLAESQDMGVELCYVEFVTRQELGQNPTPDDWYARFPQWRSKLERIFGVDRLLWGASTQLGFSIPESILRPGRNRLVARPEIDDYEILEEIGRGAMGIVFKARQLSLNRVVAIKMVLSGDVASAEELARFRVEGEAAARIVHPHVIQIFDVGETNGRPYYSLEFVDGGNLELKLADGPMALRRAAELARSLALAVDHAHQRGILHRDLKPGNILMTRDGTPKIADFGLAKRLEVDEGHTQTGKPIGTPSYMAPEQAAGRLSELCCATDVYGLGAILYELITGQPPFVGGSTPRTLLLVLETDPTAPSKKQPTVDRDLETICLKCLRKEPAARYATGAELADDLNRYLNAEPILARPVGAIERTVKWIRRKPAAASLIGIVVLMIAAGSGMAWSSARTRQIAHRELSRQLLDQLNQLEVARQQSLVAPRDRASWAELSTIAQNAEELARSLGDDDPLRRRVVTTLAFLDQESRDRELLDRLDRIEHLRGSIRSSSLSDVDRRYVEAFRARGLEVERLSPDEVSRSIGSLNREELATALVQWSFVRRGLARDDPSLNWRHLIAVAEKVDPDDLRNEIRRALADNDRGALLRLASKAESESTTATTIILIARTLERFDSRSEARELLERAFLRFPGNFWISQELANNLLMEPDAAPDKSLRYAMASLAARPSSDGARLTLGNALISNHQFEEAVTVLRQAARRMPENPAFHNSLAVALVALGQTREAIDALNLTLELNADDPLALNNLGNLYSQQFDLDAAVTAYRRLTQTSRADPYYRYKLATALFNNGMFSEAASEYERCHELAKDDPDWSKPALLNADRARSMAELNTRLDDALADMTALDDFAKVEFAQVAYFAKRYVASAELYELVFAGQATLSAEVLDQLRFGAACAAVRAAVADGLDELQRRHWRKKAYHWLRVELDRARERIAAAPMSNHRDQLVREVRRWIGFGALGPVQRADLVEAFEAVERVQWQRFWDDVKAVIRG